MEYRNVLLKRKIAEIIDILYLGIIIGLFSIYSNSFTEYNYYLFILVCIIILYLLVKDFLYINKSLGKIIVNLSIYDFNGNEIFDKKKILLKSFIDLLLLPVSLIMLFVCNKTIGEKILKINVDSYDKNKVDNDVIKKSSINLMYIYFSLLIVLFLILFEYLTNPLNYYSLRFAIAGFILIIVELFYMKFKMKNYNIKQKIIITTFKLPLILFLSTLVFSVLVAIPFEEKTIKFKSSNENLFYRFPNAKIVQKEKIAQNEFILFNYNLDMHDIYYYTFENDEWINKKVNSKKKTFFTKNSKLCVVLYIESEESGSVMLTIIDKNLEPFNEIGDSIDSNFVVSNKYNHTYYTKIISIEEFEEYFIEIDGEKVWI